MGHLWVPDADDWMRSADITVREYSPSNPAFWLSNSRSSGGFDEIFGTVVHHDAIPAGFNEPRRVEMEAEDHIYAPVGNAHMRYDGSIDLVAAGAANCVEPGTPILTRRGVIAIEDVMVGDEVWTHRSRWRRVIETHRFEDVERVKVTALGVDLVCTPHHPLWARGGWSKEGRRRWRECPGEFVRADDLGREHLLSTPIQFDVASLPDVDGFTFTPEMAKLAGAYVADGYCYHSDAKGSQAWITPRSEKADAVAAWADGAGLRVNHRKRREYEGTRPMRVGGTAFARWLSAEFGAKSLDKTIPAWLLGAPGKHREAFLDGYLHGDGHWHEQEGRLPKWVCTTSSRNLAVGLRLLAQTLGWSVTAHHAWPKPSVIKGRICRPNAEVHRVNLGLKPPHVVESEALLPVRSVVECERGPVCDLTVDEDHSYIANGIISHNTQGKGGPYRCSRGTVPLDQGNRFMWATEASNNGVGETWTAEQIWAYPRIHAAFLHGLATKGAYDAYNRRYRQIVLNPLVDVISHFEWTPRKIDAAGPPGIDDGYANMADRYMRWFMDRFRASVAWHLADIAGAPSPVPPPSGGVMEVKVGTLVLPVGDGNRMYDSRPSEPAWHAPGVAKTKLRAGEVRKVPVVFGRAAQVRITIVQAEGPCHVIAQGEPPAVDAKPFVNDFDGSGAAEKGWLGLPDGHVYLRLVGAPCHVVVDEVGAATDVTLED